MIAGQVIPDSGNIEIGETIKIGYFAQEEQEMDPSQRVIDYVKDIAEYITTREGKISASALKISSFIGASYSGTGDLFASVIAGRKARGDRTEDSVRLAGEMIEKAVRESAALGISGKEGAEYEKYLWMLCKKTKESGESEGVSTVCQIHIAEICKRQSDATALLLHFQSPVTLCF